MMGWFCIDLIAIIPFDIIVSATSGGGKQSNMNSLIRMMKLGKLNKLIRLTKFFDANKVTE